LTVANELSTNVMAFCEVLRAEHGFRIGHAEATDALRALDVIGITERERVRAALRLVCCGTHAQSAVFDRAFDAFFSNARTGVPQPSLAARKTRPGPATAPATTAARQGTRSQERADEGDDDESAGRQTEHRRPVADDPVDARARYDLYARYSAAARPGAPLRIDADAAMAMRSVAQRFVQSVRLGRSRRWKAMDDGARFDLRRTIRASLGTGGDPVTLRFLGHPFRNPRFVVLIDGSRSMADHAQAMVAFTAALCERSSRTRAFFFSTALREVTGELGAALQRGTELADLGEAWGGGTKIGASLAAFVAEYGMRLLSRETVVVVFSDGLDVGDVAQLERALREIDRRSAALVWLNPHAASPGYAPAARGMRAALPFITLLCAANTPRDFEMLAKRLARTPRIRGRQR
jgi:uncharacterized protein with von Willebrand factor type A (vWA) domain